MKKKLMPWGSMEEEESDEKTNFISPFFGAIRDLIEIPSIGEVTEKVKDQAVEVGKVVFETVKEDVVVSEGKGMSAHGEIDLNNKKEEDKAKKQTVANQNVSTLIQSEQLYEIQKLKEEAGEEIRLEVVTTSEDEKLIKLHLNTSLDTKHIKDAYHLAELKRAQIEEIKAAIKEQQNAEAQAVNPSDPLNGHMLDTNAENQRLSNAVG